MNLTLLAIACIGNILFCSAASPAESIFPKDDLYTDPFDMPQNIFPAASPTSITTCFLDSLSAANFAIDPEQASITNNANISVDPEAAAHAPVVSPGPEGFFTKSESIVHQARLTLRHLNGQRRITKQAPIPLHVFIRPYVVQYSLFYAQQYYEKNICGTFLADSWDETTLHEMIENIANQYVVCIRQLEEIVDWKLRSLNAHYQAIATERERVKKSKNH